MTKYNFKTCMVAAALLLAACSGKNDSATSDATKAAGAAATPPAAAAPAARAPIVIPPVTIEVTQSNVAAIPADIADKLKAIGSKNDTAGTAALYTPSFPDGYLSKLTVSRDLHYGPAERNILDVMAAKEGAAKRPVVIFVHGGGFGAGKRHGNNIDTVI